MGLALDFGCCGVDYFVVDACGVSSAMDLGFVGCCDAI